jgi:hypothetical protein
MIFFVKVTKKILSKRKKQKNFQEIRKQCQIVQKKQKVNLWKNTQNLTRKKLISNPE